MVYELTEQQSLIRTEVKKFCERFPSKYWREKDKRKEYPEEFVSEIGKAGWLSALIPERYGGAGLGVLEASIILEGVNRSGGNAASCHAQMYIMGAVLRHGSEDLKQRYLPDIANGKTRLQSFAITEPNAGSDTTRTATFAERKGDHYVINGHKIFISRLQHSDMILLLARTTAREQVEKKTQGLSLFLVDLRQTREGVKYAPIETMINHETNELFLENLRVPAENLVGEEGRGFHYLLDGLNAERILIAAECVGWADWSVAKASEYAKERVVFDRPIGQNQGVQFPIAQAYARTRAADAMRYRAAALFDAEKPCGEEANIAKLLASEAAWEAANVAMTTLGGYGMAVDFDVERILRETRLFVIAPVSNNLVLSYIAEHVLGLPRSF